MGIQCLKWCRRKKLKCAGYFDAGFEYRNGGDIPGVKVNLCKEILSCPKNTLGTCKAPNCSTTRKLCKEFHKSFHAKYWTPSTAFNEELVKTKLHILDEALCITKQRKSLDWPTLKMIFDLSSDGFDAG